MFFAAKDVKIPSTECKVLSMVSSGAKAARKRLVELLPWPERAWCVGREDMKTRRTLRAFVTVVEG